MNFMMFGSPFNNWQPWGSFELFHFRWLLPFALLDLVLKGFALWRAARRGESWWFVALLVVNSLGILPGIYLFTHPEKPLQKSSRNH